MFDCRKNGSKIQVPDVLPKSELRSCRRMLEKVQLGDARNDVGPPGGGGHRTREDDPAKC